MSTWNEAAQLARRGLPVEIDVDAPRGRADLHPAVLTAVVGAARELLVNVGRHAGVDRATWLVRAERDEVVVSIVDAGRGFSPDSRAGVGLDDSVRGRIARVGGAVHIESGPHGTRIDLRVPAASRRVPMSLAASFEQTLHVPGAHQARALALRVALPMLFVNLLLGLRHGLLEPSTAVFQWTTWAAVVVATWAFARRLDRGAPVMATCVGLVVVVAAMVAIGLGSAGDGATRTADSWMVGAFTVPLILLAYVVPLRWAPAYVLPDLVIVLVVIGLDPTTTLSESFGPLSTPFVPLLAGLLGLFQRRASRDIEVERARLVEAEVASRTAERRRDVEHEHLGATLQEVVPFLEQLADGTRQASEHLDTEVAVLAGLVRDDLYAPGLMSPRLRAHARDLRVRGGQLVVRPSLPRHGFAALEPVLADLLAGAADGAVVTVSPVDDDTVRVVVACADDADSVDVAITSA